MRGAHPLDPVEVLRLPGRVVGAVPCPHMLEGRRLAFVALELRARPCGEQAVLVRFPDPFGLRSYCEEGHVEVLSPRSVPAPRPLKGPTD